MLLKRILSHCGLVADFRQGILFLFPFPISNLAGPFFHFFSTRVGLEVQPGQPAAQSLGAFFGLCLKMASKSLLVLCGHLSWILGLLEVSIARLPQAS